MKYYLTDLQFRQKWQAEKADIQADTPVMIVDPQRPRAVWNIGKVKSGDKTYVRLVARITSLPTLDY